MSTVLSVDIRLTETEVFNRLIDILQYAREHSDQHVKDEIDKRIKALRIDQATECSDDVVRWDDAIKNARFMLEEYKKIPAGAFGAMHIASTIVRYDSGDRSNELLEELESIE